MPVLPPVRTTTLPFRSGFGGGVKRVILDNGKMPVSIVYPVQMKHYMDLVKGDGSRTPTVLNEASKIEGAAVR